MKQKKSIFETSSPLLHTFEPAETTPFDTVDKFSVYFFLVFGRLFQTQYFPEITENFSNETKRSPVGFPQNGFTSLVFAFSPSCQTIYVLTYRPINLMDHRAWLYYTEHDELLFIDDTVKLYMLFYFKPPLNNSKLL